MFKIHYITGSNATGSYHVNNISSGLSAMGKKKWHSKSVHRGKIAVKSVILQSGGTNLAQAIIIPTHPKQNKNVYLKFFKAFEISLKKVVFSTCK
jgi:hypothetical protein